MYLPKKRTSETLTKKVNEIENIEVFCQHAYGYKVCRSVQYYRNEFRANIYYSGSEVTLI